MDESNAIRAITIGVSTFIAILTISAVLTYYNTAKATVQEIGYGPDLYNNYANYVQDILLRADTNGNISGTDAINIINYFYNNDLVTVNIKNFKLLDSNTNIRKEKINKVENKAEYEGIINKIIPVQKIKMDIRENENNQKMVINLEGI